jgi:hypothetical protein
MRLLGIAAWVSWLLLLTIIIAPLAGYSIHWPGKRSSGPTARHAGPLIYETPESLAGIKLIKAFTMEPAERERSLLGGNTVANTSPP